MGTNSSKFTAGYYEEEDESTKASKANKTSVIVQRESAKRQGHLPNAIELQALAIEKLHSNLNMLYDALDVVSDRARVDNEYETTENTGYTSYHANAIAMNTDRLNYAIQKVQQMLDELEV